VHRDEDYYEVLQISPNAEPETVHRVYRLLAQRYHPDNAQTGNEARFRLLTEAYRVVADPEERAKYDIVHAALKRERWRLVCSNDQAETDFESEQLIRLTVLELLYAQRRTDADHPGLSPLELEALTGRAREHLEFTFWYLAQKKLAVRADNSMLIITADGVEYLEGNFRRTRQARRLPAASTAIAV
jgi:curved DNA-binding protein CbpA